MNKTFNINVNGQVFTVDEDAYNVLEKYMSSLSAHFDRLGEREVMSDIEARIAELMSERLVNGKVIVDIDMVNNIMGIIGKLDQIDSDGYGSEEHDNKTQAERIVDSAGRAINEKISKKLYKNPDDKIVAGICSGLAAWSGVDVVIIRVLWVLLCVFYALPLVAYVILWFCLEEANTPIQKLEMTGRPINPQTITECASDSCAKVHHSGCLGMFLKFVIIMVCVFIVGGFVSIGVHVVGTLLRFWL